MRVPSIVGVLALLGLLVGSIGALAPAQAFPSAGFLSEVSQAGRSLGVVTTYRVQEGDSLTAISDLLAVDPDTLQQLNDLPSVDEIQVGRLLIVPDAPTKKVKYGVQRPTPRQNPGGPSLIWPAMGPITERFGVPGTDWIGGYHMGLDIGAPSGSPIVAASGGLIEAAEPDTIHGYGNYVLIDHGNGWETLYGHMSRIVAEKGRRVLQGEIIGYVGDTGYAYGPHLHFEVRRDGNKVNPETMLP